MSKYEHHQPHIK